MDESAAADIDDPGEEAALEAEELLLADASAHRDALGRAYSALEGPALDALGVAVAALDGRAPFVELSARVRAAQVEVADVERELRRAAEQVTDDPQRLEDVRRRRQLLRDLGRKYGDSLADVAAYAEQARPARPARGVRRATAPRRSAASSTVRRWRRRPRCPRLDARLPHRSAQPWNCTSGSWRCRTQRWRCRSKRERPATTAPIG
jgi:DNA repair protein RecN (Recombination protein N)